MVRVFQKALVILLHLATLSYGQHCELSGGKFTCQELQQEDFMKEVSKLAMTLPDYHSVSTIEILHSNFSRIDYFPNPSRFVSQFHVKTLIIRNSEITHIEDNAFMEYGPELTTLILHDNRIENTLFCKVFGNTLLTLGLNRNRIKVLDLDNFKNFGSLSKIHLQHNNIDYMKPASQQSYFDFIDLSYNNLQGFDETYLNCFFTSIDLSYNVLSNVSLIDYVDPVIDFVHRRLRHEKIYSTVLINDIEYIKQILSFKNSKIGILDKKAWDISRVSFHPSAELDLSNASIAKIAQNYFDINIAKLNLSYNNISSLEQQMFSNSRINYIDLSFSGIKHLFGNSFRGLSDCHNLNLAGNKLETIHDICTFAKFRSINLSFNKFQTIGIDSFINCTDLEKLDLSFNSISHLSSFSFANFPSETEIDLSHNSLKTLGTNAFFNSSFMSLILDHSNINSIPSKAFNYLPKLELLDMSGSGITNIEEDAFFDLPNIKSIDLSDNNLITIHHHTFNNIQKLDIPLKLNLSFNRIETLKPNAFKNLNLTFLDLSFNRLSEIRTNSFTNISVTALLLLQKNISGPIYFDHTVNVTSLYVTLNGVLEKQSISSIYLEKLFLVNSSIEMIKNDCFLGSINLKVLQFWKSRVAAFESGALHGLYSLEYLNSIALLDNAIDNHILKDGIFSDLLKLKYLVINTTYLSRLEEESLSGLISLKFLNISGTRIKSLPPNIFHHMKNLEALNLSRNSLQRLGGNTAFSNLTKLTILYLQYNKLSQLPLGLFKNLEQLKVLRLDHNNLDSLETGIFEGLVSLTVLDISHNSGIFQTYHNNLIRASDSAIALKSLKTLKVLDVDNTFTRRNVTALSYIYSTLKESFPDLKWISINNNWIPCHILIEMLEHFTTRGIKYSPENPVYNTSNINGIVCIKQTKHYQIKSKSI